MPRNRRNGSLAAMDPLFISGPELGASDKSPAVATTTTICRPRGCGRETLHAILQYPAEMGPVLRVKAVAQELYSDAVNCPPALLPRPQRPRVALEI